MPPQQVPNPYRPGAGLPPPYLAGREEEKNTFKKLLSQEIIMKNMILTGLRGTGETVLLDSFKPIAIQEKWLWAGADLSDSASVSEETIAVRLLTDLSIVTSSILRGERYEGVGFDKRTSEVSIDYNTLVLFYQAQPGLVSDKLRSTLEFVWEQIKESSVKGIVFAYDEAQKMSDRKRDEQYPLSVLLEVFQSLQKREYPFLLVLTGLPTIQQRLVESRTYSERMFNVTELESLSEEESREAIMKPLETSALSGFNSTSVELIVRESGGYPYFIQFICREAYDSFLSQMAQGIENPSVPISEIVAKLDIDFFAGRWNRATDRERELLIVVTSLESCPGEFTVKEIVDLATKTLISPMSGSQVSQMLSKLMDDGLVYRTRYGKYTLGIPLLERFIRRQTAQSKS